AQPYSEFKFLIPVEVPVREIAHAINCAAPVQPPSVQPTDRPWLKVRLAASGAKLRFLVYIPYMPHDAPNAGKVGIFAKGNQRASQKALVKHHVPIDEVDVFASAVLESELGGGPTTPIVLIDELHDSNRVPTRKLERTIFR